MKKILILSACLLAGCSQPEQPTTKNIEQTPALKEASSTPSYRVREDFDPSRFEIYSRVKLTADLTSLNDNQKQMLSLLIDAAKIMDDLFWQQAWGNRETLLQSIPDKKARYFADVNYGPWDRLNGDEPFLDGVGKKPLGARFYPEDMRKEELEAATFADAKGLYSLIRRNEKGLLYAIPYHKAYEKELNEAASLLRQAAKLAASEEFANYLNLRAEALVTDNYQPSDFAWMDMKNNPIELVIGPIETYEDQLFGYRAAYEAYVLLKDQSWSEKLAKFASYLPELQKGLPVADKYKQEMPGTDADLNAYDVIYYAGHSNAGSKTIAINLPNDEQVQLKKGTRRLQLKNAMKAKFDKILVPIAEQLIEPEQRANITFDAFFANTMFHEVAHGLGIKNTINGKGTVRTSLKETASALEEGKADILGLYMVSKLRDAGAIKEGALMDNYVTFMAGIFRSVRFGASSAHGKANMVRFNFFKQMGAFSRDEKTGLYKVNFEQMTKAMNALSELILTLQGNGDYEGAVKLLKEKGVIGEQLAADLARLEKANIPVDIVFEQGKSVLGLPQ